MNIIPLNAIPIYRNLSIKHRQTNPLQLNKYLDIFDQSF